MLLNVSAPHTSTHTLTQTQYSAFYFLYILYYSRNSFNIIVL